MKTLKDGKQILLDGIPSNYYIFKDGTLLNKKTGNWLKGSINGGYLRYSLRNKNRHECFAHRLVAEYFIPNPENKPMVNHKDGNKLNNNIDNLEWATASENNYHAINTDLKKKGNHLNQREKAISFKDEIWLPYKDTTFMISNKGRAKNNKTGNLLKGKVNAKGYVEWCFSIHCKKKSLLAHRVVYETFLGELIDGMIINHIDGVKTNNQVENLEQVTKSKNVLHSFYEIKTNPNAKKVGKYTLDGKLLQVYDSIVMAQRENITINATRNGISNNCNKKRNQYKGFIWKYIEE